MALALTVPAAFGDETTAPPAPSAAQGICIGAFNFTESEVIAELYAQALEASGLPVGRMAGWVRGKSPNRHLHSA